jgi:hypothetical protein
MTLLPIIRSAVKPSLTIRIWHRLQERIRHPRLRQATATAVGMFRGRAEGPVANAHLRELQSEGCTFFPALIAPAEVDQIRQALERMACFDPWRAALGNFTHDKIPAGTHVAQIREAASLDILHRLALDSRLISLAGSYFGCKPYLDSIQAWWSLAGNDTPQEAENFHRDNDSIRFLKLFLYITDVGPENGPHVYVFGSHASSKLTVRRRLSDAEVAAAFGASVREIGGSAGDAFLEDTFGIHKGQLPIAGRRLLVQFRYSISETVFRSPLIVAPSAHYNPKQVTSLIYE